MAQDRRADDFGSVLRANRLLAGLTQEDLAHRSGVAVRTVSDLERGRVRRPQRHTIDRLARVLATPGAESALVSAARAAGVDVAGAGDMLPAVPQVRYSLPADTVAFTGRDRHLGQITTAVAGAAWAGGVVTIDGMPGVGKTALAVHVAHMLRKEFPDRQLFIDLHAHTPGQEYMRPEDALAGLLAAAGLDPRHLPDDLDGRAAMWRDQMAGQRALLVFDNAASSTQVTPLLPGDGGCLVLVTSRRHLGDLPGAVTPVLIDVLPPREAAEMFTRLAPRTAADRERVAEVVRLAGFLPLAVCLLARVFTRHPSWSLADLAAETRAGVLTMAAENDSVATAFDVSYRHLDPAAQRLFRLLGVHPGTTIDGYAAAALAGIVREEAAGLLDGLHQEGLLAEAGYRRYGMHDLIRHYARNLAAADTPSTQPALGRLLDYYEHAAALAQARLAYWTRPDPTPSAPAEIEFPALNDAERALAWARADRASLLACLDLATRTGQHTRVVALTAGLAGLLRRDGPWAEAISRHAIAVAAARHARDRLGEANALNNLGDVRQFAGDHPGAAHVLLEALDIYRDLGDRRGEANALRNLGVVRRLTGDFPGAARVLEQTLSICRDLGDRLGEANALRNLGSVRQLTGDYPGAAQAAMEALGVYRCLGDRLGEANTLNDLGRVRQVTGDYQDAASVVEQALDLYRDLGERLGQANALLYLGIGRQATGDYQDAAGVLEQALAIYRDLGERLGQANALLYLGIGYLGIGRQATGDYQDAAGVLEQALAIYRALGAQVGEANALSNLGAVRRLTGDFQGAAQAVEEALSIFRNIGDRQGQAEALNQQGTLHRARGDDTQAKQCHQQALDVARLIGSSRDEASALAGLGRCAKTSGSTAEAQVLLRQAHEIFQRIGAAETQDVLAELDNLGRSPADEGLDEQGRVLPVPMLSTVSRPPWPST